jgi:long-chain acyl-CoA synthetase
MLLTALQKHASERRMDIALQGSDIALDYAQLLSEIKNCQFLLADFSPNTRLAIALENHPAWVVLDLAAMENLSPENKTILVPLPHFFTDTQLLHAMIDAGVSVVITDNPQRFSAILGTLIGRQSTLTVAGKLLMQFNLNKLYSENNLPNLPKNTAKITYTSGTTGNPKGVCLSVDAQLQVANSVKIATNLSGQDVHCCVLPLSTLLENVAGVYAILLAGGTAHVLPAETIGLTGSSLNINKLHAALATTQANTAIFIPELLNALVSVIEAGVAKLPHLRFLAVGGAHVSTQLLQRAATIDLPVFEGYGLSECASVVALNTQKNRKIGSVGKPLPHVTIQFSEENEILVKGAQFLGYTNALNKQDEWLATGDIGCLSADGFLHINGRKKNMFITSFGRNVSPEWVESVVLNSPDILQACVFGEAKPYNIALIVSKPETSPILLAKVIEEANKQLPDYARITKWLVADAPFSTKNGQLTPNSRLKRDTIHLAYQQKIDNLYSDLHKEIA